MEVRKVKAKLVVNGFAQKKDINFDEIFSRIVKMTSIRIILRIVATEDLYLEQLDVKTTFLHGDLDKEIYMPRPWGFEVKGKENLVCKLKKILYGLKQAPRQWYLKFDRFMQEHGYNRCHSDYCVYFRGWMMTATLFYVYMLMICLQLGLTWIILRG